LAINYHQKLIYKFILSLIPFLFEKVKNVECSYLMISEQEINILLRSEQANIELSGFPPEIFEKLDQIEIGKEPGQSDWGDDVSMESGEMPAMMMEEDSEMEFSP
jgi:hypothetical protein